MRAFVRWLCVALIVSAASAAPTPLAQAANLDSTADRVFGQPDFTRNTANKGGVSATSLYSPQGVALDQQDNLYVADTFNSLMLEYDWALVKLALPLVVR